MCTYNSQASFLVHLKKYRGTENLRESEKFVATGSVCWWPSEMYVIQSDAWCLVEMGKAVMALY